MCCVISLKLRGCFFNEPRLRCPDVLFQKYILGFRFFFGQVAICGSERIIRYGEDCILERIVNGEIHALGSAFFDVSFSVVLFVFWICRGNGTMFESFFWCSTVVPFDTGCKFSY